MLAAAALAVTAPRSPAQELPSTTRPWTLAFGGDTLMTRPLSAGTDPFAGVVPPLADADIALVNSETAIALGGTPVPNKQFHFRSPPGWAARLGDAGVDAVSVANNHALDYGPGALAETVANLRAAGVAAVGAGANRADALTPVTMFVGGVRVALLAATQIIPTSSWVATDRHAGLASAGKHVIDANSSALVDAVAAARATHDVVVVVLHWGIEGSACPSAVQKQLARLLVDSGATAVLGAHPHVLQPIRVENGPQGRAVVAYSLGNFIWDPRAGQTADTGLLQLHFDGPNLESVVFYPHRLDANGWARAVAPDDKAGIRIRARTEARCGR